MTQYIPGFVSNILLCTMQKTENALFFHSSSCGLCGNSVVSSLLSRNKINVHVYWGRIKLNFTVLI